MRREGVQAKLRFPVFMMAMLLFLATPAQAEDDCGSCDGSAQGDVTSGEGVLSALNETSSQDSNETSSQETSEDSAGGNGTDGGDDGILLTTQTGPCEVVAYDTSDLTRTQVDPDGCIRELLERTSEDGG